jgi:prepilin-type processing-associated H-X9-DG protein
MKNFGIFSCPDDKGDFPESDVIADMNGNIPENIRPPHHMSYMANAIGPKWNGMFGVSDPAKEQGLFSYGGFAGGNEVLVTEASVASPSNLIAFADGYDELVGDYWGCGWWASTEGADFCYSWWNGPFEGITSDWLVDALALSGPGSAMYHAWHKHSGGANFLYADGHAKWSNPLSVIDAKYWLINP